MIFRWAAGSPIRMLLVTVVVLTLALAAVSRLALGVSERLLTPELTLKAQTVTESARRQIERALDHGVPLEALAGMRAFFENLSAQDRDIAFLAIADGEGRVLHLEGDAPEDLPELVRTAPADGTQDLREGLLLTRAALRQEGQPEGAAGGLLLVGHDQRSLMQPVSSSLLDILVVLAVASLLAFELLLLVVTLNVTLPLRRAAEQLRAMAGGHYLRLSERWARDEVGRLLGRLDALVGVAAARDRAAGPPRRLIEPRLVGVRLLAFFFVFAEELARPFLPLFLREATGGALGGAGQDDLHVGIIMSAQLVTVALAMPAASLFYERIGRRRLYLAGALISTLGLVGTGLGHGLIELLFWRVASAVGYASMFVACQGFVLEATTRSNRAQGSAMMVGGIMLADICGPAVGGILAAHIGFSQTFLLGAAVAATAGCLLPFLMGPPSEHAQAPPRITLAGFRETFRNRRFLFVLLFAAVPAKLALGGYLYVLVPLALLHAGVSVADAGRIMLLYGLAALLLSSPFARLADRRGRALELVAAGGLLAGLGMIPMAAGDALPVIVLGVVLLGVGQAMSISPQLALVIQLAEPEIERHGQGVVMACMRLVERIGGSAGPLMAVTLTAFFGRNMAMSLFGVYLVTSALLLLLAVRAGRCRPAEAGG